MVPIGKSMVVSEEILLKLRHLLTTKSALDVYKVAQLSWKIAKIDDKNLFGEDAERIGEAFKRTGTSNFYAVKIDDLLSPRRIVIGYRFDASGKGVEEFQGPLWHELNLDDCLLFSLPIVGVILRPGVVGVTAIAGEGRFVDIASDLV